MKPLEMFEVNCAFWRMFEEIQEFKNNFHLAEKGINLMYDFEWIV